MVAFCTFFCRVVSLSRTLPKLFQCCRYCITFGELASSVLIYCLIQFEQSTDQYITCKRGYFVNAVYPTIEDMAIEIKIWFTPNFVALCHSVGNKILIDFTMPCLFIYFATVLTPEYFVMLLPVNVAMNECKPKLA
jgi:hypothetical protein